MGPQCEFCIKYYIKLQSINTKHIFAIVMYIYIYIYLPKIIIEIVLYYIYNTMQNVQCNTLNVSYTLYHTCIYLQRIHKNTQHITNTQYKIKLSTSTLTFDD